MIAPLALIIWPVISVIFYRVLSLPFALSATLIGGYLFLPALTSLDLPLLPALDKHTIPALSALVLTLIALRQPDQSWRVLSGWVPKSPMGTVLMAGVVVGAFVTALANGDAQYIANTILPGLSLYDGFSIALESAMMLIPFILARKIFASGEGQNVLLQCIVIALSGYALLALYEIRMSPQLNRMIYGFFQHSWEQHVRAGGFRPIVFLEHGLWLGILTSIAALCAMGLGRHTTGRTRWLWFGAALWLTMVLVLSKVFGALMGTLVLAPVILFLPTRIQLFVAVAITLIVLTYPVLRAANMIPIDRIMTFAADVDPARAQSLKYRVDNEEILLKKANERPLFGWGGWGRNRVYDEFGQDISTTDGKWIIELGKGGWLRYISVFSLMAWGLLGLAIQRKAKIPSASIILVIAMTANLIDMLPNSGVSPITWMIAGALFGRTEREAQSLDEEGQSFVAAEPERRASTYARPDAAQEPSYARSHKGPEQDAVQERKKPIYSRSSDQLRQKPNTSSRKYQRRQINS